MRTRALNRYFSTLSFILVVLVGGTLGILVRQHEIQQMEQLAEDRNRGLTQITRNLLSADLGAVLQSVDGPAPDQQNNTRVRLTLQNKIAALMHDSDVVKIKLYNMQGITVFSTDASQIGEDKSRNAGFVSAKRGKVASELTHRDQFSAFEGSLENVDLLSSYVPIVENGTVVAVFELYQDVTLLMQRIESSLWQIWTTLLVVLGTLYLLLLLVVRHAQKALIAQEDTLRAISDNMNEAQRIAQVGSWVLDLGSDELTWSDEVFRLFEMDRNQGCATYQDFLKAIHPDDRDAVNQAYIRSLVTRTPYQITHRLLMSDGRIKWVDERGVSDFDAAGEALRSRGTVQDVTERRQQEELTRQLLAENETLLRNALVGIVHLKQRRVVACNRRFEELFEYAPGELIGESSERLYDTNENFLAIGQRAYPELEKAGSYYEEVLLRHKDGSLFWGALNGCAIDDAHPDEGSIWIYTDISQHRLAEQESAKLLQAVEQSPVSIYITDRNGVIEYVNPSYTRITGYTRVEAVGKTPRIVKSEHTTLATHQELWHTLLNGHIWRGVLRNRCKNGDLIWEETSISPIFGTSGDITNFVSVKENVTERKRIELELEEHRAHLEDLVLRRTAELSTALETAKVADQAKDEFLANITHELRTPLSAVIGFSSLARPYCTDAQQRDYLDKVNSAGKTLSGIIDDLLDLSKIVAGRLEFEALPFSLRQLVARCSSVISFKAQEKGLELVERIDNAVPDVLVGDSLRVEQILLNLLSNAVKYTPSGRVELRIGLHDFTVGRVCLNIEVQDTGIGMGDEDIARMFKPFSQADASITRKFGGTGLGLAICKRLAELMDGEISVVSRSGIGSTFRVKLWLAPGAASELPAVAEVERRSAPVRYQEARVLVVDDQPFNRDIVHGLLAVVGITPQLASNGQEALDILWQATEAFDLVLMDIQMPVMDGLTATRLIRSRDGCALLPVIAMTAHTMTHERAKCIAAGMNGHIGKPFDEAGFYRVLRRWIPRSKQHLQLAAASSPASVKAVSGLPPLRGIDTRAGLALLQGDEERYRHWLGEFMVQAPIAMTQIRLALAAGEFEPASMVAHTLKGRMGLLGMNALHASVAELETAIDSRTPTEECRLDLERGVAAMCAEIQNGLGLTDSTAALAEPLLEAAPAGVLPASIAQLIGRLQAGDSNCDRLIAGCLAEHQDTAWAPRLQKAVLHIDNFDFAAACGLLAVESQVTTSGG
ncbi:PAS domain S-box protein [Propionivibrio sp.]|uniref:PAS domain-containing hybrid sensor histidine kinase/response regulator n=1 Tax=Propionivibrio sp. TaxID=2212460 RepID=UPI003BF40882